MRRVFLRLDCYAGATSRETLRTLKNRADFGSIRAIIGTTRPHARMNLRVAERRDPPHDKNRLKRVGGFHGERGARRAAQAGCGHLERGASRNPKVRPDLRGANLLGICVPFSEPMFLRTGRTSSSGPREPRRSRRGCGRCRTPARLGCREPVRQCCSPQRRCQAQAR
jgi:hypothetical protein